MKNTKVLLLLALIMVMLTGCTLLPVSGLNSMLKVSDMQPSDQNATVSSDGATVTISKERYEQYQQFDTVLDMIELVETNYYQDIDHQELLKGAAMGTLAIIGDPYTFYYPPEDYAEMWDDDTGEYAGVGILISSNYQTNTCTVIRVFTGSPAEKAGVRRGDVLKQVEDIEVYPDTLQDAVDIMRGTPGTDVHVTFLRDGEERETVMTRAVVNVNRVESGVLEDHIGYIYLYEFAGDCADKFEEALNQLVDQGIRGLIIDLRDNPGGWTADAEKIADLFLDEGIIYYLEYKNGYRENTYSKDGKTDLPLVVLINENSASSSEILTGALKDRADATIVGVQSYGKGIVQAVVPVGNEGAGMQMTIAQYYTPNGNQVHQIGITPDVIIELPEDDPGIYEFADDKDIQLNRAIQVMKEKLQ
jgi:carboxyl-terminal processing protease